MKGLGFIIIFLSSFFFLGIITRVKSIASGRKGPGLFQPMWDIFRLLKKGTIYSSTTSFILKLAPIIYFATILSASFLLPFHNEPGLLSFQGDFIHLFM